MKFTLFIIIYIVLLSCLACNCKLGDKSNVFKRDSITLIDIGNDFRIIVPTFYEKFDSCKHYSHFEIWNRNDERIYQDTTLNEYTFLCNNLYTKSRKLKRNKFEILIQKFDEPDIDKTLAIYIKGDKYDSERLLPFFDRAPQIIDGKEELFGIMYTIDSYVNSDSCYYNPILYFKITNKDLQLDSLLTKNRIIET